MGELNRSAVRRGFINGAKILLGLGALFWTFPAAVASIVAAETAESPKCDEAALERPVRPFELVRLDKSASIRPRLDSDPSAYGLAVEDEAAHDAVADYAVEFDRPSDSGAAQQARAQAALTRLAGSIDESRSLYNRLLGRAYRPRLERPQSPDPGDDNARFALATKLLEHLDRTELKNCEAQEAELRDAANSALVAVARDRAALGRPDPLIEPDPRIKPDAPGLAGLAARAPDMKCGSNGECVLLARGSGQSAGGPLVGTVSGKRVDGQSRLCRLASPGSGAMRRGEPAKMRRTMF